jgi:HSP20 family protein
MALAPREYAEIVHPLRAALARLAEQSTRLVEESVTRSDGFELLKAGQPYPANLYETPEEYLVEIAIAGIRPDDVHITADAHSVTVRGAQIQADRPAAPGQYVLRERYTRELDRTLQLPGYIDPTRLSATAEYGVLRIRAPRVEVVTPQEIAVLAEEPTHLKRTAPIR